MGKTEHSSLPAGNGSLPGLGEAFSINLSTGTATYSYQIAVPEGVAKHTPKLVLEYAHGTGQGPWGLGWRLPLRSISAALDFGTPDQALTQRFLDGGAEIAQAADGTFRALRESLFARYSRQGDGWRVEERNGSVHLLGTAAEARIADPDHPDRVVEWLVERSTDSSGNEIRYRYLIDGGFAYPLSITYASYEVRFRYEDRPDTRRDGRAGFLRIRGKRCIRVELVLDPGAGERTIRNWAFGYELSISAASLLGTIDLTSHGADGSARVVRPTVTLGYSRFDPAGFRPTLLASEATAPPPLSDPDAALVTLDDAPLPGILSNSDGREHYWAHTEDGRWSEPRPVRRAPLVSSFGRAGLAFVDMDGSGTADLMVADPGKVQGYYENAGRDGWGRFVSFPAGRRTTPSWSDSSLRLLDADGDGLVDAMTSAPRAFVWWRNEGVAGWSQPVLVPKRDPGLRDLDLGGRGVHLADMTGDGLPDIVRVRSGRIECWPNLGRGRFGSQVLMTGAPRLRRHGSDAAVLLVDLDGDGCADLIQLGADGVSIHLNRNGASFGDAVTITGIPAPIEGTVRPVNLTGAATTGLVWNTRTTRGIGYVRFDYVAGDPPYLLEHIDNGAGLSSEILYRSAIDDRRRDAAAGMLWTTNFPFPYLVVGGTRETDQVSGRVVSVEYRYHEAHFERHTRQFHGFRRTERIEKGDASRPDSRQMHHFLMAQEQLPGNGAEHAALNGLLRRVESYSGDESLEATLPYRVETCEHELIVLDTFPDGRKHVFVCVRTHREDDVEETDDVRTEVKHYTYDALGNAVREVRRGSGTKDGAEVPANELTTDISFATSTTRYLLDKPARVIVRDGAGTLVSEKRLYYDGPDFVGLGAGAADRGLVTREEEWVLTRTDFDAHYAGMDESALGFTSGINADGVASVFAHTSRSAFDAKGLATATLDPLGTMTQLVYDVAGLFRTRLVDALGDTAFDYDRATGQVTKITYADGSVVSFAYDAQGRVLRSALEGQDLADPPIVYAYDETTIPNRRRASLRLRDGSIAEAVTYFDGYGKELQQRVEVEAGRFLVSALKVPNPWGDLAQELEPTFAADAAFALAPAAAPSRRFFYDARGRVVRTVNFNSGVATAEYQPFRVMTRDANDNDASPENVARGQFDTPHEEEFDTFRQLVAVTEHLSDAARTVTRYTLGPMGELLVVTDSRGEKFSYTYDRRGCRLIISTREAGRRKVWYDAAKKPVRTLDETGHDIAATWDTTGRLLKLHSGGTDLEVYTYDTIARNAFGRLAEVRYQGGRQIFDYDPAGRLTQRSYFYDGEASPQTLRYEYDPLGRETAVVHTDGTRVERDLTANGWVSAIPGVLSKVDYDPRGFPTHVHFANGVTTTYGYTPGPGVVASRRTETAAGGVLEDVSYTYDGLEIMLGSNDTAPGGAGRRRYGYDPLYQLTSASSLEGGASVERRYDYVADYNLRRFEEARSVLHYDDPLHGDRLAGVTVDGHPRFDVLHDTGGKVLELPGQSFTYNAKNELVGFTTDDGLVATYSYDHLGLRMVKHVDDGHGGVHRTLFVGRSAEVLDGVAIHTVRLGATRVALLTGGAIRFVHEDTTGSTLSFTDAAGHRAGRLDQQPFGNLRSSDGTVDHRTFSLHPVDAESGLVYMHRRYYSPAHGRFLTPDLMAIFQPEKFLHAPQGLHLYAFVANDPLDKTDPTGLSFWSFVGSVVGVVVGVVVAIAIIAAVVMTGGLAGVLLGIGLALVASLAVTGVSYLIASNVDPNSAFGQFMRGFMIGFNTGMNATLATAMFGPWVGIGIGIVGFLATFDGIAQNSVYQGILGWSSWLMPMSWAGTGMGLLFYAFNLIVAGVTGNQWSAAKIDKLAIDWKTGTIVMVGGAIRNQTAFNLGNFVFINKDWTDNPASFGYDAVLNHETGHTLNNAAFGVGFSIGDFVGEQLLKGGATDYGEQMAESHTNRPGRPTIPMWG
jgi:RHS repeat-associated protein